MVSYLFFLNDDLIKYGIFTYIIFCLIRLISNIYSNFFRTRLNFTDRYGTKSWVFITGSTDGLGRAYANEFAKIGFNIILVSRSLVKLKSVAQELMKNYSISVEVIEYDFNSRCSLEDYQSTFGNLTEKYDISIVINNVGVAYKGLFSDSSLEEIKSQINVNVTPQTLLTKIFSNYLSTRSQRSAVIDLSSFASTFPLPGIAVYSATKSFNYFLSSALAEEFENYNIDFLCVKPLFVATHMSKMKANSLFVITPEQSVKGSLNDLGYTKQTYGHWKHKLQAFLYGLIPMFIFDNLIIPRMKLKTKRQ